jgi:putative membrane protein
MMLKQERNIDMDLNMIITWEQVSNFLLYLVTTLGLIGAGLGIFLIITPYKEMKLIKEGTSTDITKVNAAQASAHDLGGKMIGLCVVLASAIYHSANLMELILWGLVAIVAQIVTYYLFGWITPFKVAKEIQMGNVSVAILGSRLSLGCSLIIAALIS